MVKIGKKLKGFDEEINKIDNNKDKILSEKNNSEIKDKKNERIKEEKHTLYFKEIHKTKEEYDDLDFYLKNNNISIFLVLLLYKIITKKPNNVCNFILNELGSLLQCKLDKSKEYNFINKENTENPKYNEEKKDILKKENINCDLKKNQHNKIIDYETFLGENHLSLDNLLDAVNFIKIENSDKIYFNNLIKIIEIFENSQNKDILLKENMQPTDFISLNKAENMAKNFYNNYFYNSNSSI
ncbi:conserved Plasmodium protein, unknown function [Plasmodium relictum]|uniref:Uncharacterized protein n=1 Tax=Plasmodium relictum TaxID=85471 RepID=A0A1J1H288_PLARL|nr:conserved Plasmodium protein, unknown function [Plasmodium relictum]CRG99041.1 conserved Plasmodium protein, unknown function [Plasmodium relictum]